MLKSGIASFPAVKSNYTVSPKPSIFYLLYSCQKLTDFNDFWHVKSWENLTRKSYRLSTDRCSHCTLGNPKVIFNSLIHTYFWLFALLTRKQSVIHLPTPTWKCHHTNLWIAKLEPVVMCGSWNVRQAMSQQVFTVTTFCVNTCFQSLSTLLCWNSALVPTSRCRKPQHVHINPAAYPRRSTRAILLSPESVNFF